MNKQEFVEFCQHQLSGGLTVDESKKKYPTSIIEYAIGLAVQDISSIDERHGADNIKNYLIAKNEFTPVVNTQNKSYFSLPYEPLSGPESLVLVSCGIGDPAFSIHPSVPAMNMMSELKGSNMRNGVYPMNDKWYFVNPVTFEEVYISMIPSFDEYNDEDDFVFGDQHLFVFDKVQQIFARSDSKLMDQVNQQIPDNEAASRS